MPSPKLEDLSKRLEKLDSKVSAASKGRPDNTPEPEQVFGAPFARKGESAMTSRGFQFQRLFGLMGGSGVIQPEHCKVEMEVCERMRKSMVVDNNFNTHKATQFLAPLGSELMGGQGIDENFRHEIKSLTMAGTSNFDPDEASWIKRKTYGRKTDQSWLDESLGGALVAPPEFGELIQLLRNTDAIINAGARVIPLPASGRIKYPRQTSPTTGYYVGENSSITESNFGTGSLILTAKKVAALVTMPNELIRFASPASEAIVRADMTKTLSLTMDKYLLEGTGGDNVPLGILLTPGIATVTRTTVATDGNSMARQDLFKLIGAVESDNGEFRVGSCYPICSITLCRQEPVCTTVLA